MTEEAFLAWALPQRGLRWRGFRRNRRQVVRRLRERIAVLGLASVDAYRALLGSHAAEWTELERLCRVTISRFARDRAMWDALVEVFPAPVAATTSAWSAGCGAGEEPFTLALAWACAIAPRSPGAAFRAIATDIDERQLARAAAATFPGSALRELPTAWRAAGFDERDGEARVREEIRGLVTFERRDVRDPPPAGAFDLVLCRNLAFSYFDELTQAALTRTFRGVMRAGAVLVVGGDERLPDESDFAPRGHGIYVARSTAR